MSKHGNGLDLRVFLISSMILLSESLAFAITLTTIDVPSATSTTLNGVNARGKIVGTYSVGLESHAFLRTDDTVTIIDVPGATNTEARGINDSGQIVGFYFDGSLTHGFLLEEVSSLLSTRQALRGALLSGSTRAVRSSYVPLTLAAFSSTMAISHLCRWGSGPRESMIPVQWWVGVGRSARVYWTMELLRQSILANFCL